MIYTDGTITIKAGSPIVTGTGTQWKKNIHGVAPGQMISIENGTNPINMMIRAVNSDTELVLSFNAPVARSGAKYSIATTVPDTISDAARTMSANQGYIVYFLQAMQQWMTDTGQVEIELPNGQKVTLDSVKAMNEAIAKKADSSKLGTAAGKNTGTSSGNVMEVGTFGVGGLGASLPSNDYNKVEVSGIYGPAGSSAVNPPPSSAHAYAPFLHMQRNVTGEASQISVYGTSMKCRYRKGDGAWLGWVDIAVFGGNVAADSNGFIKKASPIIQIHPSGSFETNDESEGTEVHRTGTGQYHITCILGYNSDGAWGVSGGISVPKDNNGLELVYVADRVMEDGGIIIETCHRQHAHLPDRFQNWRLKEITTAGDRVFYQDGEPCDLPEYTRLDVRVEMPQGSVWNVKQRELVEQMEREQAEREAAEQVGETEE